MFRLSIWEYFSEPNRLSHIAKTVKLRKEPSLFFTLVRTRRRYFLSPISSVIFKYGVTTSVSHAITACTRGAN